MEKLAWINEQRRSQGQTWSFPEKLHKCGLGNWKILEFFVHLLSYYNLLDRFSAYTNQLNETYLFALDVFPWISIVTEESIHGDPANMERGVTTRCLIGNEATPILMG